MRTLAWQASNMAEQCFCWFTHSSRLPVGFGGGGRGKVHRILSGAAAMSPDGPCLQYHAAPCVLCSAPQLSALPHVARAMQTGCQCSHTCLSAAAVFLAGTRTSAKPPLPPRKDLSNLYLSCRALGRTVEASTMAFGALRRLAESSSSDFVSVLCSTLLDQLLHEGHQIECGCLCDLCDLRKSDDEGSCCMIGAWL